MELELGEIRRSLQAPERLRREKPLWRDLLLAFLAVLLPMLIIGHMEADQMESAGMSRAVGWILTAVVVAILTPLALWLIRARTWVYIRMRLELRERGISGVCRESAWKTREFAVPYAALRSVRARKERLRLRAGEERIELVLDEAETLAAELRQHTG